MEKTGWLQQILSRFAGLRKKSKKRGKYSEELAGLCGLDSFLRAHLTGDHYVAGSEYKDRLQAAKGLIDWFCVLRDSRTLERFCRKQSLSASEVLQILSRYQNFPALVDAQNEQFIQSRMETEKEYLDHILKACDPAILLDADQRRVVLSDEDYTLVVAGAGAGKTTTVAAKVKYLVEKQGIDPKDILVISFTNKAVAELKQRIIGELHIECPIATFHSTGNAILHIENPEKKNIVDGSRLYYVVRDYFRGTVLQNESAVNNLILFFASYFDAPYEGEDLNVFFNQIAKQSRTTMRSELDEFHRELIDRRSKQRITIQSEILRSQQEVEIANFLYLNGIDYEYEPVYPYHVQMARKPYTPDFIIRQGENCAYLEHFGVSEDGKNSRYPEEVLKKYRESANDKVRLHRKHGTKLIYTFSSWRDGRSLTEHLTEALEGAGFVLKPRSAREIMEKLVASEENRYIRKLVMLICRFINNFKVNGYTNEEFGRMARATGNVRTRLFLNICQDCYLEYERWLHEHSAVDFQDMINESARVLNEVAEMKQRLHFKYIIVDEYQDISRQRFDLVKALREVTDAKIMAVGDDWQSIYAFSGSDITLFTKFSEKMGYAKLLKIVRTYRNAQEIIDIAGNFIQKNREQIEKELISPKHIMDPVLIYTYDSRYKDPKGDNRSGVNYAIAHAVETALEQIMAYNKEEGKPQDSSILLLGRFGFDGDHLERSGLFEYVNRGGKLRSVKYPRLNITFMTAHSSKGLGYDNVIVVNGRNETYGFPSKIEDDPVLSLVVRRDSAIEYAEERRLFYVAMTRTKNRVFFIAPKENPSEFLLELKQDYKNVALKGFWNEDPAKNPFARKTCPVCGYPLQLRYKAAYGLRLYICTNEPEICSFMTNEVKAGKLSIIKCDQCRDGYLVIKPNKSRSDYFLGCTNYKKDGTGCRRTMSAKYFYEYMEASPKGEALKPLKAGAGSPDRRSGADMEASPKDEALNPRGTGAHIGISDEKPAAQTMPPKNAETRLKHGEGLPENGKNPDLNAVNIMQRGETLPEKGKKPEGQAEKTEIRPADFKEVLYRDMDLNQVLVTVLQCLSDISEKHFYTASVLEEVLRGETDGRQTDSQQENSQQENSQQENSQQENSQQENSRQENSQQEDSQWEGSQGRRTNCQSRQANSRRIRTDGLDQLGAYGSLKELSEEEVMYLIDWLIRKECIRETKGRSTVLHPTWKGIHYDQVMTRAQVLALKREMEKIFI